VRAVPPFQTRQSTAWRSYEQVTKKPVRLQTVFVAQLGLAMARTVLLYP
jgi:hypothetical protein